MPLAFLQLNPWRPSSPTSLPHDEQPCGWQSGDPSLSPHAILKLVLSSFSPRAGMGMAFSQSDECSPAIALSLAFSTGRVRSSRSFEYVPSQRGVSQQACTDLGLGCTALSGAISLHNDSASSRSLYTAVEVCSVSSRLAPVHAP